MTNADTLEGRIAPGPPGRPWVGNLPQLAPAATRFQTILGWQRTYGDIFRIHIGRDLSHVVTRPDAIKHVLVDQAKNYPKSEAYSKLKDFLGNGLFTAEGDFWLRQRRMMQPYFHLKYVAGLVAPMADCTRDLLARWEGHAESAAPFDVAAEMMRLTLRVVGKALMSTDVEAESGTVGQALALALEVTNHRIMSPLAPPLWMPTKRNRHFRQAGRLLDGVVYGVIAKRRQLGGEQQTDLLGMLLAARDEETNEGMTERQLRDEVMTLILAGHETTAAALAWIWVLLSRHPEVERKLHAELEEVLEGREPTYDDLGQLAYTTMVIEEAMRVYPPIFVIQRQALADDVMAGFRVPAGSLVTLSIMATHHNPAVWENPEGFDPERFRPERQAERHRYAYLPFGGGGRVCIGNHFAMLELKLIVAMIAQRFKLQLVPGHPIVPEPMVTLRPKHGVLVRLARR